MKFSAAGMELLKRSEGFRDRVYLDVADIFTIGYGHRLLHSDSFPNGINELHAANLLACDVRDAEQAVQRLVTVPLTQGQFDALVDFTFNLGAARLAASTLLKSLNAGRYRRCRRAVVALGPCQRAGIPSPKGPPRGRGRALAERLGAAGNCRLEPAHLTPSPSGVRAVCA